jgi:putative uncharacterized protein (fragment)
MPENVSPPSPNDQNQENKKPRFNLYTWLFDNPERFFWVIVLLGILGGLAALIVPNCIDWQISSNNSAESKADEIRQKSISDLRLHILYITGGIIAILTLLQNSWKNQIDRRKIEDDIQKNKNDHIRQVHAERRSRYAKAIEQLGDEKAPIRLGGVYTLVGLADEWLTDKSIREVDDRSKEGQVIVNSLCSYLRALPPKTKPSDLKIGKYLYDEAEVRIAIVKEISARINFNSNSQWSDFKYDLSNIFFFYPVNFSNCIFKNPALFSDSYFAEGASFEGTNFKATTNFSGVTFRKKADFSKSYFKCTPGEAIYNALNDQDYSLIANDFSKATFMEGAKANFSHGKVYGEMTFHEAEFKEGITLSQRTFFESTSFTGAKFEKSTNFYATFVNSAPEFVMKDNNGKEYKAKFSIGAFVNDYKMETNPDGESFPLEDHTLLSNTGLSNTGTFTIPKGCRLFDPKNPSKQLNVTTKPHQ